ncbi:MAG TPA: aminomethyl-transferring glycine dehydrogenase subunit GcvPA [Thermogutta sp.]|nr:aminomethyl-transferring glycine dehydrogenase subunit GcvPA [Thermogutta sp.]
MAYLPQTEEEVRAMLAAIGVPDIDSLFAPIPSDVRLNRPLQLPPALTELELTQHLEEVASQNQGTHQFTCFLGGGAYDHFIPAVVDFVASRSEFYTSYTPYQPEVSQGNLQVFFEYQTLITQLTGMDVSNASLYDGASALAEAVLMALGSQPGRRRVIVPENVHPEYRTVLATYLRHTSAEIVLVPTPKGIVEPEALSQALDAGSVACVILQQPNFFGCVESAGRISEITHQAGAILIAVVDPISLGMLRRPGDYGADIVVAEGQPLGLPMAWGGPYLGILACRETFLRRLPGRLVGQTVDRRGNRCWVLTLQTREQHIRREKATSNICTNQGLMALRATVYLAAMGPGGLRRVAEACLQKAHRLYRQLIEKTGLKPLFSAPFFKEFALQANSADEVVELLEGAQHEGFFAGLPLGRWYPQYADALLIAVTEKRTEQGMDHLVETLSNLRRRG